MRWNQWYRLKSYFRSALWIVPLIALLLENVAIRLVFGLHERLGWLPWFGVTPGGTSEALKTIDTLAISFIVFSFGSLLVAIQVASGQLTPRIIATTLLRNNVIRFAVGLFTFTMLFAAGTSARLDSSITHPAIVISWWLGVASIAAFLFLIDYTARLLRPVSILWRVGEQGVKVVESVFPDLVAAPRSPRTPAVPGAATRVVEHRGTSAVVLAANVDALVALARRAEGVIAFVPRVGDFVATGEPLYRLYGNAAQIDDRKLRAQVAFGSERTMEQDATFAFRVIVDIGIKALSPAINDPTTAVLAIDQLDRLLSLVTGAHGIPTARTSASTRRRHARRKRRAAPDISYARLGRLRSARGQRNSPLRRGQLPGIAAAARND
jgi:uncharacterized membrane protein